MIPGFISSDNQGLYDREPSIPRSWYWSLASLAFMVFFSAAVVPQTNKNNPVKSLSSPFFLLETAPTDDVTHNQLCQKYIYNFLNGSTDLRDECEGLYNAFQNAGCNDTSPHSNMIAPRMDYDLSPWYDWWKWSILSTSENGTDSDPDNNPITDDYIALKCCDNIGDFYQRNCENNESFRSTHLLGVCSVLILCGLLRTILRTVGVLQWVPNAGVCVLVGAGAGLVVRLTKHSSSRHFLDFDNSLFLQILLPPIIFQASLCIDKRAFRRDLFPILTFAVLGTGVSALAIGYMTHGASSWFVSDGEASLPLLDSLLFGALMSSIDPVATLGILTSVGGVQPTDTLYTLVFGESLLNDGVSIVLFDSLVMHMGDSEAVGVATFGDTLGEFVTVISGSIAVGVLYGGLCTMYFWLLADKQTAMAEVGLFFVWALIPYYVADGIEMSGIIAIMVMGFMMDFFVIGGFQNEDNQWMEYMQMRHHSDEPMTAAPSVWARVSGALKSAFSGHGHVSETSRQHVGFVAEVISSLMETAIFAYLGLFLFNEQEWNFMLMSTGTLACIVSRAGMVVAFSFLVNVCVWIDLEGCLKRAFMLIRQQPERISLADDYDLEGPKYLGTRTQLILFSAGVRGAVSYALVQNIPVYNSVTGQGSHFKGELKAMTSATIVILLFLFGAITYYSVQRGVNGERSVPSSMTHSLLLHENDETNEDVPYERPPQISNETSGTVVQTTI